MVGPCASARIAASPSDYNMGCRRWAKRTRFAARYARLPAATGAVFAGTSWQPLPAPQRECRDASIGSSHSRRIHICHGTLAIMAAMADGSDAIVVAVRRGEEANRSAFVGGSSTASLASGRARL
jgi:hypothetical protein